MKKVAQTVVNRSPLAVWKQINWGGKTSSFFREKGKRKEQGGKTERGETALNKRDGGGSKR